MNYNYHTHTYRCGHAVGSEEEYINIAVKNGIEYMGFSDHIPLKFPDGTESSFRMKCSEAKEYCDTIKKLAEKHKDKIDIKVGFETECYPEYFDKMLEDAILCGAEYLILGQHYIVPENVAKQASVTPTESVDDLKKYVCGVVSAIERKVFTYVAHPDIFNFAGDNAVYENEMRKICISSRKCNVPLEINFLGIRTDRKYPNDLFWKIAGEEHSPVTFGFDAHALENAFDGESEIKAMQKVEKYGLNYIGKPEMVLIQNLDTE